VGWGAVTGGVNTCPAVVSTDFWRALRVPFPCAPSSGMGCSATVLTAEAGADEVEDAAGAVPKIAAVKAMTPTVTKLVLFIFYMPFWWWQRPGICAFGARWWRFSCCAHCPFGNAFGRYTRNFIGFQ
jgi:hypothetical protein